jgi:predicted nucleic acid-binding protein
VEIERLLKNHKRIALDTAPIIYYIEEHKVYGKIINKIFKIISNTSDYVFSSVITLIEVMTYPLRESKIEIADKYEQFLLNSDNFILFPIDSIIAKKSAELRAKYGIKTPDAIQLSVAIENSGSLFITNDKNLKKVKEIDVLVLDDYL